MGQNNFENVQI